MKTGRYSLGELLNHNEIEQIVIPEIQRDYVWGTDNVAQLLKDIVSSFEKKQAHKLSITVNGSLESSESVTQFLTKEYERLKYNQKLGFIYAYHDREYAGKFFLIDGQQRFTTLFLVLLHIYKSAGKADEFRAKYFGGGKPKLDYKVREQSHDFLRLMIDCELNGENFMHSIRFYKSEYSQDTTVSRLIANYKTIQETLKPIADANSFLCYLEDFVEVNYFDTHLSEQGEQLYLYMNSRGEQLSYQELLRAALMQKIESAGEKIELALEWEKWQNFFWIHRGHNENADKGFEEFLKWATVIHIACGADYYKVYSDVFHIEWETKKDKVFEFQKNNLVLKQLSDIFDALVYLESKADKKYVPFLRKWLTGSIDSKDYLVLLPTLQFITQNDWVGEDEKLYKIECAMMFVYNTTYYLGSWGRYIEDALSTTALVKEQGCEKDVANFVSKQHSTNYVIRWFEEKIFDLYKKSQNRRALEEFVWDVSLDNQISVFLTGNISVLFTLADSEYAIDDVNLLKAYFFVLKNVIYKNRDSRILHKAMLCNFDFKEHDGQGKGIPRYCLLGDGEADWEIHSQWRRIMISDGFVGWMYQLKQWDTTDLSEILRKSKLNYFPSSHNDYRNIFIECQSAFSFLKGGMFLYDGSQRFTLLRSVKSTNAGSREVQCTLLEERFRDKLMWVYQSNFCVLGFVYNPQSKEFIYVDAGIEHFALDIVFNVWRQRWTFTLVHRAGEIDKIFNLSKATNWQPEDERITLSGGVIYDQDPNLSFLENNEKMVTVVNELLSEVETLFQNAYILEEG